MTNSRDHKKDESCSSSESYTSDSECLDKKHKDKKPCKKPQSSQQAQPDNSTDKITDLSAKMNKCIKFTKYSDKKLEKKLHRLNKKLESSVLEYKTVVNRLRKEKHLMVNGSDAYGMFYSYCPQVIEPNNKIMFEKKSRVLNLRWEHNSPCIKISRAGMYVINFTCQFEQPGQIAIFVNDNPELSSLTSTNNPENFITIHQVLFLEKHDVISIRNYLTPYPLTTSMPSAGIIPESKNVCLNIWKIAPEPEKCALPPKQNKEPWCYFESADSSSSDSDSSDSDCSLTSKTSKSSKASKKSQTSRSKKSECSYEESSELSESCFANPGKYFVPGKK